MSKEILDMSGAEAATLAEVAFAILPLGSVEYHGPHAALGTDVTLAVGFARCLVEHYNAVVYPPITYTFTPTTTSGYRGSIFVSPQTMLAYVQEILHSIVNAGVNRILALNGHSENQYIIRLAAENLAQEHPQASVLLVNWWKLVPEIREGGTPLFSQHSGHGHGGPLEISTAAALNPAGVHPDLAANIDFEALWWKPAAQIVGAGQAPQGWEGYHGQTDEISVSKGEIVVSEVIKRLQELVNEWQQRIQKV